MSIVGLIRLEPAPGQIEPQLRAPVCSAAAASPGRWGGNRAEAFLLVALAAIAAVPVWAFKYFATTDGGAHVANADVLLQYFRPAGEAYRAYYELNPLPVPNGLGHFTLAMLMVFLPARVAEKVFVTLVLVLLPLAVRYAACAVRRSGAWVGALAVPLSLNWLLHQGFYNFLISVVIFFVLLGYWLRRREAMNVKRAVVLGVLGVLLYAGHLLSVTLACVSIFILAGWFTVSQVWRLRKAEALRWETIWPGIRSRFGLTFAGLLPAILLVCWFQRYGFTGKPTGMKLAIKDARFWKNLATCSIYVSYRAARERPLGIVAAMGLVLLVGAGLAKKLGRRQWNRRDGVLLLPIALAGLYFTRGDAASGQLFIPQRLVFYTYLSALLFIAAASFPTWARRGAIAAAFLLTIIATIAHWPAYRGYNSQIAEFLDLAGRIEPRSTLLPLVFAPRGVPPVPDTDGLRSMPFFSAAGYAAMERKAVDLRNYEAGLDYFPVRYRPALNPYQHLGVNTARQRGLDQVPQRIDLARYERVPGAHVDYVLLWGRRAMVDHPDTLATMRQLRDQGYELVATSPGGRAELWSKRR
jgi:hypothetical protein